MSKPGHNSKAQAGPIDHAKLKSYVERIEAVESEEADYKAAKKDIYVEVKAAGMRPKMVRKIVRERKKTDADAEEEQELALYRAALEMPGATFRSVSKDLGVPRSTLHRLVPRNKNGTKPEDGDDGITESCGGVESRHATDPQQPSCRASGAVAAPAGVASGPHDTSAEATLPGHVTSPFPPSHHPKSAPDLQGGLSDDDPRWENLPPTTPSVGAVAAEPRVAPPFLGDDPGPQPPFLRRTAQGRGAGSPSAPHPAREQGGFEQ